MPSTRSEASSPSSRLRTRSSNANQASGPSPKRRKSRLVMIIKQEPNSESEQEEVLPPRQSRRSSQTTTAARGRGGMARRGRSLRSTASSSRPTATTTRRASSSTRTSTRAAAAAAASSSRARSASSSGSQDEAEDASQSNSESDSEATSASAEENVPLPRRRSGRHSSTNTADTSLRRLARSTRRVSTAGPSARALRSAKRSRLASPNQEEEEEDDGDGDGDGDDDDDGEEDSPQPRLTRSSQSSSRMSSQSKSKSKPQPQSRTRTRASQSRPAPRSVQRSTRARIAPSHDDDDDDDDEEEDQSDDSLPAVITRTRSKGKGKASTRNVESESDQDADGTEDDEGRSAEEEEDEDDDDKEEELIRPRPRRRTQTRRRSSRTGRPTTSRKRLYMADSPDDDDRNSDDSDADITIRSSQRAVTKRRRLNIHDSFSSSSSSQDEDDDMQIFRGHISSSSEETDTPSEEESEENQDKDEDDVVDLINSSRRARRPISPSEGYQHPIDKPLANAQNAAKTRDLLSSIAKEEDDDSDKEVEHIYPESDDLGSTDEECPIAEEVYPEEEDLEPTDLIDMPSLSHLERKEYVYYSPETEDGIESAARSESEGISSDAEEQIDNENLPIRRRHSEKCSRCEQLPSWKELKELHRLHTRLDQKRTRSERQTRRRGRAGRRSTAAYEGSDQAAIFGSAQAVLDERKAVLRERGGWLQCRTCTASVHIGCQSNQYIKAILKTVNNEIRARHKALDLPGQPTLRTDFSPNELIDWMECETCITQSTDCMLCRRDCLEGLPLGRSQPLSELFFRCSQCTRTSHYKCILEISGDDDVDEAALTRQQADWKCFDCECETWKDVQDVLARRTEINNQYDGEGLAGIWIRVDRILDVYVHVSAIEDVDLKHLSKEAVLERPRNVASLKTTSGIAEQKEQLDSSPDFVHISQLDDDFLDGLSETEVARKLERAELLVKWEDLEFAQATWQTAPRFEQFNDEWTSFFLSLQRFSTSRKVYIKELTDAEFDILEAERDRMHFQSVEHQPDYIVGGEMLDFQLEGLNWLRFGWQDHQPGILADEMGLGKTVQVIAFVAALHHQFDQLAPYLIVVPNSVVMNWVREFEKWTPHLRVVPYYGGRDSRNIVEQFELFHSESLPGRQDLRADVVITSDTVARISPPALRRVQQWQSVIVDEGANLKAGKSTILYRRLSELKAAHRLIITGTPLNNNIGELFNLLNWLKPNAEWENTKELGEKFAVLSPEHIAELQTMLRPYFLRRLKRDVVNLPPRSEVLVPVSLTPLQKRVYKDVLEANVQDIQSLIDAARMSKRQKKSRVGNLLNILMQLRKVCQHPFMLVPALATRGRKETQADMEKAIDAWSKLLVLQKMLPKLKAKGRRLLIFSQFLGFLDLVETLLESLGEGHKFLRLDGFTTTRQRQQDILSFNNPTSEHFCYLLSTRAGGVGINLAGADTVIILDSDFNPHVDMQAIARAHRIGQTRKVLVFTLLAKGTAEERIVDNARKKLVLDRVIHAMDDDESRPESLQEALRFGARSLFQEGGTEENEQDTLLSSSDIDQLIVDCEQGEDVAQAAEESGGLFSFANVWEREAPVDHTADMADEGFWNSLLEKARAAEADQEVEDELEAVYGRGGNRKAKLLAASQKINLKAIAPPPALVADQLDEWSDVDDDDVAEIEGGEPASELATPEPGADGKPVGRKRGRPAKKVRLNGNDDAPKKRGRPRKVPLAEGEETPKKKPSRPRLSAIDADVSASPASAAFGTTSRSLPRVKLPKPAKTPRPPKQPKQPKERRPRIRKLAAAGPARVLPGGVAGRGPPSADPKSPNSVYTMLATVRDPSQAMALCTAAFAGRPQQMESVYKAWMDIMTKAYGPRLANAPVATPSSVPGTTVSALSVAPAGSLDAVANGGKKPARPRGRPRGSKNVKGKEKEAAKSAQTGDAQPTDERPAPDLSGWMDDDEGAFSMDQSMTEPATPVLTSAPAPATTAAKRGRARKPAGEGRATGQTRKRAPKAAAANKEAPPAATTAATTAGQTAAAPPTIAGLQQPGQAPIAQQPSILDTQPSYGFMESLRSREELEKMMEGIPEAFMADVRVRHAQGKPKPLIMPEHRSQLTKTHMAYFSLRVFNFLMGVHPLFNDAFSLVQSEQVPPKIRAQPFEGAEMLSVRVVSERLTETAHYFYAQLQSLKEDGPPAKKAPVRRRGKKVTGKDQPASSTHANKAAPMSVDRVVNQDSTTALTAKGKPRKRAPAKSRQSAAAAQEQQQQQTATATEERRDEQDTEEMLSLSASTTQRDSAGDLPPVSSTAVPTTDAAGGVALSMIPQHAAPPPGASQNEQLAFIWLQAIDSFNLQGLSKASRMWLVQPVGAARDVMGNEINARLAEVLATRRRLGQPIPTFFRQAANTTSGGVPGTPVGAPSPMPMAMPGSPPAASHARRKSNATRAAAPATTTTTTTSGQRRRPRKETAATNEAFSNQIQMQAQQQLAEHHHQHYGDSSAGSHGVASSLDAAARIPDRAFGRSHLYGYSNQQDQQPHDNYPSSSSSHHLSSQSGQSSFPSSSSLQGNRSSFVTQEGGTLAALYSNVTPSTSSSTHTSTSSAHHTSSYAPHHQQQQQHHYGGSGFDHHHQQGSQYNSQQFPYGSAPSPYNAGWPGGRRA
ncbi:unnamed protein product [Sympodiomycopsis kandeliae]